MKYKSLTCSVSAAFYPRASAYYLIIKDTSDIDVKLDPRGNGVAPALILQGMMPCAPWEPTVAIKIRVLEAYRVTHVRCPQLAIQAYVKSLCDIHGVRFYCNFSNK